MQLYRNLVLLTAAYPLYGGEYFLEDELSILASKFETIYIFCFSKQQNRVTRPYPKNIIVIDSPIAREMKDKISFLTYLFDKNIFNELKILRANRLSISMDIIKTILNNYLKAVRILNVLQKEIEKQKIDLNQTIFYSYWNDHRALALSMLTGENCQLTCLSRAHGWDIDYHRTKLGYLPFKFLILSRLNQVYTVSESGQRLLNAQFKNQFSKKISIARLGKFNNHRPQIVKKNQEFTVVSCSNMIPLKRIHLIIDFIVEMNLEQVTWYHFGSGPQKEELLEYASNKLSASKFQFLGVVPNTEILEFYSKKYVDLFINLSESEGIPVSIMEAQSAAIPVLATDVGGTSEIVTSENGFLIEKNFDLKTTASLIKNFLTAAPQVCEEKRNMSYSNWKKAYNADVNYQEFYKKIAEL